MTGGVPERRADRLIFSHSGFTLRATLREGDLRVERRLCGTSESERNTMRSLVDDHGKQAPGHVERAQQTDAPRREKLSQAAAHGRHSPVSLVQAKLTVGPASDRYEQEADRVASAVMADIRRQPAEQEGAPVASPDAARAVRRYPTIGRIQPKAVPSIGLEGGALDDDTDARIEQARGGGASLGEGVRRTMESAFGADFSGVRVHNDSGAHDLSQKIQAKAFTTGSDIFFGKGQFQPGSDGGQELLAHELTHVVQQGGVAGTSAERSVQRKAVPGLASLATAGGTWTDAGNGVFGFDVPSTANDVVALVNAVRQATANDPVRIKVLTGVHGHAQFGDLVGTDAIDPAQFLAEDQREEGHSGVSGWTNVLNVRDKKKETVTGWMKAPSSVVILAWCYSSSTIANWATIAADWEDGTNGTGFNAW